MPKPLSIELNDVQRAELEKTRDRNPLAYLRERAAAVLKIAAGASGRSTAQDGLLKPHSPDTLYEWVKRYIAQGVEGLKIRAGRGRKPAYAPTYVKAEEAQEALLHTLHQSPMTLGQPGTRWQLATLLAACGWLNLHTVSGLSQLLQRLDIHYKQARRHVHSPDVNYVDKLRDVRVNLLGVQPGVAFVFQDEFTFYRQPRVARAYELVGKTQPLAELGLKSNAAWRIAATLNGWTGQVTYLEGSRIAIPRLVKLYQKVAAACPDATVIKLAQDNWPVHFHPDVLAALQSQTLKWPVYAPANWPTQPSSTAARLNLPIQLFPLPTYASWTNPIEKLWRWLNQEVLCLHGWQDDWAAVKQAVRRFLDQFAQGSLALLRYVGLSNPVRLYHALFPTSA
jgi:transposase